MRRPVIVFFTALIIGTLTLSSYANSDELNPTTFQRKPMLRGICEDTAHTLNLGSFKFGDLSVPGTLSQWKHSYLKYGLTNNFQVGTTLAQNFLGRPNLTTKYKLPFKGPGQAELAVPANLNLNLDPLGVSTNLGLAASWNNNSSFNFHAGANLWLVSYAYRLFNSSAYLMVDYNLLSNTKLIGELDLQSFGEDFLTLRAGGLIRPLDFLNLKLNSSVDVPSGDMSAWASLYVRF